ncbi:hypothetical protein CLU79DRAFT_766899, partial [Phycomyces nitens]
MILMNEYKELIQRLKAQYEELVSSREEVARGKFNLEVRSPTHPLLMQMIHQVVVVLVLL